MGGGQWIPSDPWAWNGDCGVTKGCSLCTPLKDTCAFFVSLHHTNEPAPQHNKTQIPCGFLSNRIYRSIQTECLFAYDINQCECSQKGNECKRSTIWRRKEAADDARKTFSRGSVRNEPDWSIAVFVFGHRTYWIMHIPVRRMPNDVWIARLD